MSGCTSTNVVYTHTSEGFRKHIRTLNKVKETGGRPGKDAVNNKIGRDFEFIIHLLYLHNALNSAAMRHTKHKITKHRGKLLPDILCAYNYPVFGARLTA